MSLSRRGFLRGMAGILASGFAPAVIGSGVLMPVRAIWRPDHDNVLAYTEIWSAGSGIRIIPNDPRDAELARVLESAVNYANKITGIDPYMLYQKMRYQ